MSEASPIEVSRLPKRGSVYLGIDLGHRRVGVAISDPDGRIAVPSGIVERSGSGGAGLADLADLLAPWLRDYGVAVIVVGLPTRTDGTEGPEAAAVRAEVAKLAQAVEVPVEVYDERFTSRIVHDLAVTAGITTRRVRGRTDDKAAALILQSYLDFQRNGSGSDRGECTSTTPPIRAELAARRQNDVQFLPRTAG